MPSLQLPITPSGATVHVLIDVTDDRAAELNAASMPTPIPKQVIGFIDPGASHTVVRRGLLSDLGATRLNGMTFATTGGQSLGARYLVKLSVVALPQPSPSHEIEVVEAELHANCYVALGRDFLRTYTFFYDGPNNRFTLAW